MLLGGAKNYLVVMEDVDWDLFIENFIHSCYGSAGQRCLAGSIIAAVPEIYDELIERITAASKEIKVGDATLATLWTSHFTRIDITFGRQNRCANPRRQVPPQRRADAAGRSDTARRLARV